MAQEQSVLGTDLGKKAVRLVIAIVALLILRAVLGALPMLANASSIGNSLMSPLVIADVVVDAALIVVLLRFGLSMGRSIAENSTRFPDVGKIVSLATLAVVLLIAYKQFETPTACLVISPADLSKAGQGAQLPFNLDQIVPGVAQMMQGIANAQVNIATGVTLAAYQKVAVVVLRLPPDIYGWTFLILIALPVVGIVVLVSRNLDAFTDAVFHASSASSSSTHRSPAPVSAPNAVAERCGSCGQPMAVRSKFCSNCGTPSSAPTVISSAQRSCSSCGADNPAAAKFCKECGQAA
jgi:hypothetical protein